MVNVTFIDADGVETKVSADADDTVMNAAIANGVDGIIGECGGSMMCATCHCHIDKDWASKTGERMDGEDDMLDCAASEVTETSRLSCQVKLSPELDGLVVHLPAEQI